MSIVLGKCPKCGQDVLNGQYGAYCTGKCGFSIKKAFGRELKELEVKKILAGEEVLLDNLVSNKDGNKHEYSMFVKSAGVEEYEYKKKDGSSGQGYRFKFNTRYPDSEAKEEKVLGKCPNCKGEVIVGRYGAYCKNKCGFSISKAFGRPLAEEEIKNILSGNEVLLKDCISRDEEGNEKNYDIYVTAKGAEEYEYTKKDSSSATGYRIKFETRFPENNKPDNVDEKEDDEFPAPSDDDFEEKLPF